MKNVQNGTGLQVSVSNYTQWFKYSTKSENKTFFLQRVGALSIRDISLLSHLLFCRKWLTWYWPFTNLKKYFMHYLGVCRMWKLPPFYLTYKKKVSAPFCLISSSAMLTSIIPSFLFVVSRYFLHFFFLFIST
jgi:hypothetical protein